MGSKARRGREKENMRVSIMEAATKIILNEGYDNLTMRKLADAIEYTPTTIYSYYKDKAQIIDDIVLKIYSDIVLNINIALKRAEGIPVDKQLEVCFKVFIRTMVQNPEMGKAVIVSGAQAMAGPGRGHEPPEESGISLLHGLLVEGQRQSILRVLDENVPWMIISALVGFSMNALQNQLYLNANWDRLVDTFAEFLLVGLNTK